MGLGGWIPCGGGIQSLSPLTLTHVHVMGNTAVGGGGGVDLRFADSVLTSCTFSNNSTTGETSGGGGIRFQGNGGRTLRLINSTISGNSSFNIGGGIINSSSSGNNRLEITNSTIADNTAFEGGGVQSVARGAGNIATTMLRNTIVTVNLPNNLAIWPFDGSVATMETFGFNLSDNYAGAGFTLLATDITGNALLGPLQNNDASIPTHALLAGSPALDAGNSSDANTDQRGLTRPIDLVGVLNVSDGADIGAFEAQITPLSPVIFSDGFEN